MCHGLNKDALGLILLLWESYEFSLHRYIISSIGLVSGLTLTILLSTCDNRPILIALFLLYTGRVSVTYGSMYCMSTYTYVRLLWFEADSFI